MGIERALIGCLVAAALAVSASGCGGQAPAAPKETARAQAGTTANQVARPPRRRAGGGTCEAQVGGFLKAMDTLRNRLAVGLTYEQYVDEVRGIKADYAQIPVDRLGIDCLLQAGTPAEKGFDVYIAASRYWAECAAQAGCRSASIETRLQQEWKVASGLLSKAQDGLKRVESRQ
jgi:hypothetical protein